MILLWLKSHARFIVVFFLSFLVWSGIECAIFIPPANDFFYHYNSYDGVLGNAAITSYRCNWSDGDTYVPNAPCFTATVPVIYEKDLTQFVACAYNLGPTYFTIDSLQATLANDYIAGSATTVYIFNQDFSTCHERKAYNTSILLFVIALLFSPILFGPILMTVWLIFPQRTIELIPT